MSNRKSRRASEARQRQAMAQRAKAFASTPQGAAIAAVHESLTTPESEDWTMLVDGDDLHMIAMREIDGSARAIAGRATVSEFQSGLLERMTLEQLGVVTLILPTDAEERGGYAFLAWMQDMAEKHDFNLLTMMGNVPTDKALASWNDITLRHAESAGEA